MFTHAFMQDLSLVLLGIDFEIPTPRRDHLQFPISLQTCVIPRKFNIIDTQVWCLRTVLWEDAPLQLPFMTTFEPQLKK